MRTKTTINLEKLKEDDIWSLILFSLYKLESVPELSTLSRMAYLLDRNNMLKLCEYFGGLTIKIPTIEDLEIITYTLLLYQLVNVEKESFAVALQKISERTDKYPQVKKNYTELVDVLSNFVIDE